MNRRGNEAVQNVKDRLVHLVDPNREAIEASRRQVDQAYDEYKGAAVNKRLGDATGYEEAVEGLQGAHRQHGEALLRQSEYDARLRAMGLIGLSGVAVPGVSGIIGYQGAKAGGQDGNV